MSGKPDYAGRRTAFQSGDSVVISLPKRELGETGVDPEELLGEDLYTRIQDGQMIVDIDDG